jgi:hypothetical protein
MILLFVVSIVGLSLILYFGTRLRPTVRLALLALVLLLNLPTIVLLLVGDKPLPGARTITQEELQDAAKQ